MKPYQFTVDGEMATFKQIQLRLPQIQYRTLLGRVNRGLRTWAELGGESMKEANRRKLSGALGDRDADDNEDGLDYEFDIQMDEIAPDRHVHAFLSTAPAIAEAFNESRGDY